MDSNETKITFKTSAIDFTSGTLAGIACTYVGQPLDTVKVKMQTFPEINTNMVTCFKETLRKDGVRRGLYAGTIPALLATVSENAILFTAYGSCQKLMCRLSGVESVTDLPALGHASAGFLAAFFSSFTLCPTELVKCKLQALREVGQATGIGPFQMTRSIIRENGVLGMFKGLTPTIVREMPGYFFFFGGYEGTRYLLTEPGQSKDDIGLSKTMLAGAVGGTALWTSIYPADVIKSRMQVASTKMTFWTAGCEMVRHEGFRSLYNGLTPTLVRTIPASAAVFAVYEYSKKLMYQVFGD